VRRLSCYSQWTSPDGAQPSSWFESANVLLVACACGKRFSVADERRGHRFTCPNCGQSVVLSGETAVATASITSGVEPIWAPRLAAAQAADAPQKIGKYKIVRKLGQGAMGVIWLAHDPHLTRDVAIKVLPEEIARDAERLKRFVREARSAARLNHPNTVTIYDIGAEERQAYIVMELVDGDSLEDHLRLHGPLEWGEATRAIRDAAAGLAAAHELGMVHRDIKPANLMRTRKGVTKVVDFGLARTREDATQLTQAGMFVGTPAYMAPEQGRGAKPDARGDLYSLTCAFYALLTGRAPFDAPTVAGLIYQHVHEPFPDPRTAVRGLPEPVCRILAIGAQKDPAHRYQTAIAMQADLEDAFADHTLTTSIAAARSTGATADNTAFQALPRAAARFGTSLGRVPATFVSNAWAAFVGSAQRRSSRSPRLWLAGGAGVLLVAAIIFAVTNGTKRNYRSMRDAEMLIPSIEPTRSDFPAPPTPPPSEPPRRDTSLPQYVEENESYAGPNDGDAARLPTGWRPSVVVLPPSARAPRSEIR